MRSDLPINIRCWQHKSSTPLEDMILGIDEKAVMDSSNILSSDEFDACIAIVFCKLGSNTYAHLAQVIGHYRVIQQSSGMRVLIRRCVKVNPMK